MNTYIHVFLREYEHIPWRTIDLPDILMYFSTAAATAAIASVVSDSMRHHRRQPTRLPVPRILQARTLEWVVISFSNAWKWKVKVKSLSHVRLFVTLWTAAHQVPLSMGFSSQEYWRGCHCFLEVYNYISSWLQFMFTWSLFILIIWIVSFKVGAPLGILICIFCNGSLLFCDNR